MFSVDETDPWLEALAGAFWQARARGFYTNYGVDGDTFEIYNSVDDTIDMPPEDQQIIVIFTAIAVTRSLMLSLPTTTRAKAGPVETELQRSSTLLGKLLADLRAELEDIKATLVGSGRTTQARVIDSVLTRSGYMSGAGVFIN